MITIVEYIDKNRTTYEMWQKLYELEEKLAKEHGFDICERHNVQIGFKAGLKAVVNMPTIDVVHCSECIHRREYEEYNRNHDSFDLCVYCEIDGKYHDDDWFCADARRRV